MYPILFRIPLPHRPLMLWWALAAAAALAIAYAVASAREKERGAALTSILVAAGALGAAFVFRTAHIERPDLPIYSYGVMLGLSLVVGWYLTLSLAERDGLPKETMANCYVITAVSAVVGSRLLYVATNPADFDKFSDLFAFTKGGLAVYGGFLGGYLASWIYLRANRIRLMPWADVAVPSLASGLMITRIGCYLFGCDFGKPLPEGAPSFLQRIGTFPQWKSGTVDSGGGSPAYERHLELFKGTPLGARVLSTHHSLPVHPTQLYESLVGLLLLVLVLYQRKNQKFRGQIFFVFAFGYGYLRFLLEMIRDDPERGPFGPMFPEHAIIPGSLLLMSLGFCFGLVLGIKNAKVRTALRALALVPPVVAYVVLRPPSFGNSVSIELSTNQWIGLVTAVLVSYFYAQLWNEARRDPRMAMSLETLGPGVAEAQKAAAEKDDQEEDEDEDEGAPAEDAIGGASASPTAK